MNTTELIDLTKQLMRIPSTADNPEALREAIEFLGNIVAQHPDITIERFESNGKHSFLAYRGVVRPDKFDILLNAHVDVVPGKPELFKPRVKAGKLYGRGALDMKGTAVVLTDVFCELVNEVPYSLALQVVSDEEIGGYDCVQVQLNDGVRSEFVVVGEYANTPNTIYNAARGLCWAEIAFSGKSAHGGHLWHGTNAVVKAGDFAGAVLRRYPTPDKESWTTTASIANLTTPNEAYNKVPDRAVLKIDFRFTQEDPVFYNGETVEAFIHSLDPDAQLINLAVFEPAVKVGTLNPYVQGLSAALHSVTGAKPNFQGRPASSDGRHYALVHNDIVEFGLHGEGSHSDNECVSLSSFGEYQTTMRAFLRQPIPTRGRAEIETEEEPQQEQLLRQLVAIPSASSDRLGNNRVLMFIEQFLSERGMHIQTYERNGFRSLVATTRKGTKRSKVLLNAHTDVVPAAEELLILKTTEDKLYGRGVMDMKHAIAAYLTVVDSLRHELKSLDFGLMITSDEEIGGRNGVMPLVHEDGYRPGVVIVPDGGNNWEIETFAKGAYWIELEAIGVHGHASRPWEGKSAIRHLLLALSEIETLVPADPKPTDTLLSVGTIEGGVAANQIPAHAKAMLDVRTGSIADHKRLLPQIQAVCKKHGVKANVIVNDLPCVTYPEHPMIKPMVDIITETTGIAHGTTYDYALTDGRFFNAVGVPIIVVNPEGGAIHTDDEWISRTGFSQFCQVLEQYVRRMAANKTLSASARRQTVANLAKKLNSDSKPAYVWYVTYGTGLSRQNFMLQLTGGQLSGSKRSYQGCTDATPPLRDAFIAIPYPIYFAGECDAWGGGHVNIDPQPNATAHTISRAYLITIAQFEEIVAQQNGRNDAQPLPLREAMRKGHTTVGDGTEHYNELVFCGVKDDIPMFSLTTASPELPYTAPSPIYTQLLCKGLSENAAIDQQTVIEYVLAAPGVEQNYTHGEIAKLIEQTDPRY